MSTKKTKSRAMPAHPSTPVPCLVQSIIQQVDDWPKEAQKVKDEHIHAFYREYAKTVSDTGNNPIAPDDHIRRITAALTQYTARGSETFSEEFIRQGSEPVPTPSQEELMELYATLLRDNLDLEPKMRELLTDQSFASATLTNSHGDQLEHHFLHHHHHMPLQAPTCGCGVDHGDHDSLDFPDDSYEDEPDEEDDDDDDDGDDDDDDDEDDDDVDDEDDEDSMEEEDDVDDEDDAEQDVVDGYAHHYEENNVKMMAYEEEKLKMETVRRVREEERRLKEELRKKKMSERLKQKQEKERILLLQRLRLEDEERRKREAVEKQRREKLEEEMRRKREAAETDQAARCFLFRCTSRSQIETVKQMVDATPADSCSLTSVPRFATAAATRLAGWEYMSMVEGVGEVSEERGCQETLLHVAVRVGCADLAIFFIRKGAPLDALDADGLMPLHTAAKHVSPFEICKLLVEKTAHHIDRTCITSGKTALHYASQNGYSELVALLLQHHARINALDLKGNTPESLAKSALESALAEKVTKTNTKQANTAKAQKYRATLHHLQEAMAVIREAQSRKDAQLEEQRRKEDALAREEAEKDKAARRKQEEKLEADLRRRLEEEKALERLKAMASDPHGNNNNSNKKKKKKKGKTGNESQQPSLKETPPTSASAPLKSDQSNGVATTQDSTAAQVRTTPSLAKPPQVASPSVPAAKPVLSAAPSPAITPSQPVSKSSTPPSSASTSTSQPPPPPSFSSLPAPSTTQAPAARIPKPKTSYRPSHLVVSRMMDMGFPMRDSRKALIQSEGKVEDAIDLLTSGNPLADDSEDEAEQAAEKARLKALARSQMAPASIGAPKTVKQAESYVNGQGSIPSNVRLQQPIRHVPPQLPVHQHGVPRPPSNPPMGSQTRPVHHPVQILQRTPAMAPHVQMRSVPTQVLQRPMAHSQNASPMISQPARKSLSTQGSAAVPSHSSSQQATTIESFIAPRTAQPLPPTRAPYTYGPPSSQNSRQTLAANLPSNSNAAPGLVHSTSSPAIDRAQHGQDRGLARKFGSMDLSGTSSPGMNTAQTFGSGGHFSGFSVTGSSWDANLNKNPMPISHDLPAPISAGFQSSMSGHNLWATPGLSLAAPLLQPSLGSAGELSSGGFGSPFMTSLPASHPRSLSVSGDLDGNRGFGGADLDLGNANGEMVKDVLAMTGVIDAEELAAFETEYSLLDSSSANHVMSPSRVVGGGRTNHPMTSLWGNDGFSGLSSPIRSMGTQSSGQSHGSESKGFNGPSMFGNEGVSEYSQWSSGFSLDQSMYGGGHRQSSSSFTDSFFGSSQGNSPSMNSLSSPMYDFAAHSTLSTQQQQQQLRQPQLQQQQQQQQQQPSLHSHPRPIQRGPLSPMSHDSTTSSHHSSGFGSVGTIGNSRSASGSSNLDPSLKNQ